MTAAPRIDPRKKDAAMLMEQGRIPEARQLLQEICRENPADAEAFYLLGSSFGMLGHYQDAVEALQKSLELRPDVTQTRFALGGALKMLGQFEEAAEQFQGLLEPNPHRDEARLALADTLGLLGRSGEARRHYEEVRNTQPDLAAPHYGLGAIADEQENYEQSLLHYRQAVKCEPQTPRYLCAVGNALNNLKRWQEARGVFRKVLDIAPDYPDALGGLARIYDSTGDYKMAVKQIEPLLQRSLYSIPAGVAFLNVCKHVDRCEEAVNYVEGLLKHFEKKPAASVNALRNLHITTARALDHMGRYDEAFAHFKAGNEASPLDRMAYDPVGFRMTIDKYIEVFTPGVFMRLPRSTIRTDRPVFIIGMPRSGTSLTEQIFASHPQVEGAGELPDIGELRNNLQQELKSNRGWPYCIDELTRADDMNRLARRYLDRLRGISKKAYRVTDKMPHNFYALGLIQLLFPEAHVIHCRRDPLDTCLSIYFQNFLDSHVYARNLFNLGTHYRQYQRLMEHWRQVLTLPMLDIQYEELVSNPEPAIRRMLEFCGLEWDDRCLQFHQAQTACGHGQL